MEAISGQMAASQMVEQASEIRNKEAMGQGDPAKSASFQEVMSQVQAREVEATAAPAQVEQVSKAEGPAQVRLQEFLDGVRSDETRLDAMMDQSMSGKPMSQQDLLQMQALIYSYSQKVDMASKAVSNAAGGMKQLMNTQV